MIHITKSGFKHFEWNGDLRQDVEEEFRPVRALRDGCKVEEGVTLADIIIFTYRDEFLRSFIGEYSSCDMAAYYQEVMLGVDPPTDLKYITAAMQVEVDESAEYKLNKSINAGLDLYGRGDGDEHWGLDFSTMREIGGVPFVLRSNASVTSSRNGVYAHEDGFEYTPTLLEVLDAIFYEISFHGGPVDKAEFKNKLTGMAEAVMNGTAKTVPFDLCDRTIQ